MVTEIRGLEILPERDSAAHASCSGIARGGGWASWANTSYQYAGDALRDCIQDTGPVDWALVPRRPATVNSSTKNSVCKKRTKCEESPGHSRDTQQRRNAKLLICC